MTSDGPTSQAARSVFFPAHGVAPRVAMDARMGKLFDAVGAFFSGGDNVPLRLSLGQDARGKLYLMAVGHYRNGDYPRSQQLLQHCLEIQPDWGQALALKKTVEDKIGKDGVIGIGIATTAVDC